MFLQVVNIYVGAISSSERHLTSTMSRSHSDRVATLRSLVRLLNEASETIIREWRNEDEQIDATEEAAKTRGPTRQLFDAQRTLVGACHMCIGIVDDPFNRIADINYSAIASRVLCLAVQTGIPDFIDDFDEGEGVAIAEISRHSGIREADVCAYTCLSFGTCR